MEKLNSVLLQKAYDNALDNFRKNNPFAKEVENKAFMETLCIMTMEMSKLFVAHVFSQLGHWEDVDVCSECGTPHVRANG